MDIDALSVKFAHQLKALREQKNLSQQQLAEAITNKYKGIGVTISADSIMYYETVEKHHTKFKKNTGMAVKYLWCFADFFEVSVDYLLGNVPHSTTDENQRIACEYTGLSEESVKALRFQSSYSAGTPNIVITLINTLLENRGSMQRATKDIYRSALLNFHDTRKTQHNTAQSVEELLHGIPEQLSVTDMKKLDNQIKTKALANFRSNKNWTIEVPADIASKLYEDRAAARFDKMVREAIGRYTSELSKLVVQIDDDPCGGE